MSERPRVILDALLVRPEPTGVGHSILELTRAMSGRDHGLDFIVLTTHPEMFSFLHPVPHWRVRHCPGATGGSLRKALYTQIGLPRLVRHLRGSLLHSMQFIAPLQCPCPLVITVHDLSFMSYPETIEQPRRSYYRLLVPRSLVRADRIVTNSAATAAEVSGRFPDLGDRIVPTLFGTPSWVWRQPPAKAVASPTAPFLFVGTLEPRKNLEVLLDSYDMLLRRQTTGQEVPDLVLVGAAGWRDSHLNELIRDLQERGKLRREGYCQSRQLWRHYCSARALLFPSLQEGFGFPILEAMAAGLPVLTSNRGAMREVAGGAAYLVDPEDPESIADGLQKLHCDESLRQTLIRDGLGRARALSWDGTAAATFEVYRQILGGAAEGRS